MATLGQSVGALMFKVRVGVVVFDEQDRILLARQNNRPFWVLPGGTLEPGETMGACAVREIKEEANLDIALGPLLYVSDFLERQAIDVVFLGELQGGTLTKEMSENLNEIGFFSSQDLTTMDVRPQPIFDHLRVYWKTLPAAGAIYL